MIEYIKDEVAKLSPANVTIGCNSLGYTVNISSNTYAAIQGKKEYKLHIYEAIREDAHVLYGSTNRQEHELFPLLISVSGIGGSTARMILSALSPSELINTVSTESTSLLKTVEGIGLKTAQRVMVDLENKMKPNGVAAGTTDISTFTAANAQVQEEAIATLTILGFAQTPSQEVIMAVLKKNADTSVEQVIKLALKRL